MHKVYISVKDVEEGILLAEDIKVNGNTIGKEGDRVCKDVLGGCIKKQVGYIKVEIEDEDKAYRLARKPWGMKDADVSEVYGKKFKELKSIKPSCEKFQSFEKEFNEKVSIIEDEMRGIVKGRRVDLDLLSDTVESFTTGRKGLLLCLSKVDKVNNELFSHSFGVGVLAGLFGESLGLDSGTLRILRVAGLLHDIGKLQLDEELLMKKEKYSDAEFSEVKKHTLLGFNILKSQFGLNESIRKSALMHHERVDGSGYPARAKNGSLSTITKIVGICDVYDAMTSSRTYRERYSPFYVSGHMGSSMVSKLDTELLYKFLKYVSDKYVGSFVELDNGEVGEVVFTNRFNFSNPTVNIDGTIVDLSKSGHKIVKVL